MAACLGHSHVTQLTGTNTSFKPVWSSAVGQAPEVVHLTEVKEEVDNSWTENCEFKCPVIYIKKEEIATVIDQYSGVTSTCWVACDVLHVICYSSITHLKQHIVGHQQQIIILTALRVGNRHTVLGI